MGNIYTFDVSILLYRYKDLIDLHYKHQILILLFDHINKKFSQLWPTYPHYIILYEP